MPIRTLLRFATAPVAVVVLAFLCKLAPLKFIDDPFLLFYPVLLVGACVSGMQSALLATALAAVATDHLFFTSMYSAAGHSSSQDAWLTTFVFGGAILSVVVGALRELARPRTKARPEPGAEPRIDPVRPLAPRRRRVWRFMPAAHDAGPARLDVVPRPG